jgi:hypothetical protein
VRSPCSWIHAGAISNGGPYRDPCHPPPRNPTGNQPYCAGTPNHDTCVIGCRGLILPDRRGSRAAMDPGLTFDKGRPGSTSSTPTAWSAPDQCTSGGQGGFPAPPPRAGQPKRVADDAPRAGRRDDLGGGRAVSFHPRGSWTGGWPGRQGWPNPNPATLRPRAARGVRSPGARRR